MRKHTIKILNVILCAALFCTFSVNNLFAQQPSWLVGGNNSFGGYSPLLGPTTNDFLGLITNNTRRITILSDGKVGIGTASPNNLLQVLGLINFDNTNYNTSLGYQTGNALSSGTYNTFLGYQSGLFTSTSSYNAAMGYKALYNNTVVSNNTAIGSQALYSMSYNTTAFDGDNTAVGFKALYTNNPTSTNLGFRNTALGSLSLYSNTTGNFNTGSGQNSLYSNTTGGYNTGTGNASLYYNTTGNYNTASGTNALFNNTKASNNIGFGYRTLYNNRTSEKNTAIGNQALYTMSYTNTDTPYDGDNVAIGYQSLYSNQPTSTSNGYRNTGIGNYTLYNNSIGAGNTAIGYQALNSNVAGSNATAIGYNAMQYAYNYGSAFTNYNVALGYEALRGSTTAANNSGNSNTAIGYQTLWSNTTGYENTAIGYKTLYSNTIGYDNVALGYQTLYYNTEGAWNCAIGFRSLENNTTGSSNIAIGGSNLFSNTEGNWNIAIGAAALSTNTTASENVACGHGALYFNQTGAYNTAIGGSALIYHTSGDGNTALGYDAGVSNENTELIGAMALGYNSRTNANYKIVIGTSASSGLTGGYGAWQQGSDGRFKENIKEEVPGLIFINKLRPVTYTFDAQKMDEFLGIKQRMDTIKDEKAKTRYYNRLKEVSSEIQTGFIAQEVETTANEIGYIFDGVHKPVNDNDNYTIGYATFVVPLVKAVQELNKMNDSLKTKVEKQETKALKDSTDIAKLNERLSQLEALVNQCCNSSDGKKKMNVQDVELSNGKAIVLDQNVPNPFAESTTISYFIPDNIKSAQIIFTDNLGRIMKTVDIKEKGQGMLKVYAQDLSSGIYSYTLIADGKTVDSKKMVKTK